MAEHATDRAVTQNFATDSEVASSEDERVRAVYARRREFIPARRYARTDPFTLCSSHEREEEMASLLRSEGLTSLAGLKILDVGCGRGDTMRQLLEYGADPELLTGIDLLEDKVNLARRLAPHLQVICGSATRLPFPNSSFDLVLQFTLFTSILNEAIKHAIAPEM